jgi:NAD-dependent SIR2 family protein deacetylase
MIGHRVPSKVLKPTKPVVHGPASKSASVGFAELGPVPAAVAAAAVDVTQLPIKRPVRTVRRLQVESFAEAHGILGSPDWAPPRLVAASEEEARPGYDALTASEYLDDPDVLDAKVTLIADLIRKSSNLCVYTGAGISTAAGIGDYASIAPKSLIAKTETINRLKAEPTYAHRALAAMEKKGLLKHWVQQNHDGLAQKAGYPKEKLNEIHGSWFDIKNPVVLMDDNVRSDLYEWLLEWEQKADLTIAMGSSLCGMNADRMAATPARKAADGLALGLVIANLQRTQYDGRASVRVFAKCDDFMRLLAQKLKLKVVMPKPLYY